MACGGDVGPPATVEDPAVDAAADPVHEEAVTLIPAAPNGGRMPDDHISGVPPYPGATLHTLTPAAGDYDRLEAFTGDDLVAVVAFYDAELAGWAKQISPEADLVTFERPDRGAAVTVTVWLAEDVAEDAPPVLRGASTAIGVAWRSDIAP